MIEFKQKIYVEKLAILVPENCSNQQRVHPNLNLITSSNSFLWPS